MVLGVFGHCLMEQSNVHSIFFSVLEVSKNINIVIRTLPLLVPKDILFITPGMVG